MEKSNSRNFKSLVFCLLAIAIGIYLFVADLPFPSPIRVGLDPSWQYAISRAATDGLIFGKDIIFTYGPLGYLVAGATLEENFSVTFAFTLLVNSAFIGISIVRIVTLNTYFKKISFAASLLFIYLFLGFSLEYVIIYILLIILSFDESLQKSLRWWSLGLGVFAGFCLLTKFSIAISTVGSLVVFLLGQIMQSRKSNYSIADILFSIMNVLGAAVSVSFILLAPDYYWLNFRKILICLAFATVGGILFYGFQERNKPAESLNNELELAFQNPLQRRSQIKIISLCMFYFLYFCCLMIVVFNSYPSWIDYITGSLQITSGYSSAMSIVGSRLNLFIAISEFVFVSALIIKVIKDGSVGFGLALLLNLFLSFKHGFVRQDGHILAFASTSAFIVSIGISKLREERLQKLVRLLNVYVLIMLLGLQIMPDTAKLGSVRAQVHNLNPKNVASKLSLLFNPDYVKLRSLENLETVKLPEDVKSLVKDKPIDIIPWEISLAAANDLNWKPRPIFQSYSAYTSFLDTKNFVSLSKEPREYIFYQFASIDGRHPFFDEPQTFYYVFCHYEPSSVIPDFINLPSLPNLMLLAKRQSSRCSPSPMAERASISWDTPQLIEANDEAIIRAKVTLKYSVVGKIYKTLFRVPPVMMKVNYVNGSQKSYRIIPENSENGVIVSHLPKDDSEAMSFFRGAVTCASQVIQFLHKQLSLVRTKGRD